METLHVETEDRHQFELAVHLPQVRSGAPVVICFPAMGVSARFYEPLANKLTDKGIIAVRAELRGLGSSSIRPSRKNAFGYFDMIRYDYPAIMAKVREHFPGHPVYVLGHSLGGQLAVLYAAMHEEDVDGVILVAAGSVHYKRFGRLGRYQTLLGTQTFWAISSVLGSFPGHRLGFAGHESRGVIRDWAHQARTGQYRLHGGDHDAERLLGEAQLNLLAISIEGDTLAPPAAMEHLCGKLSNARVHRWHYRPPAHLKKKVDHFRWVKHSDAIVDYIAQWLESPETHEGLPISKKEKSHADLT